MKLDTPQKMVQALADALSMGWRGTIEACHDRNGNPVWVIELNGDDTQQVAAELGQTLNFTEDTITR